MGAPLEFDGNTDLWVSNAAKDFFCDVVVESSKKRGNDISRIFEDEPAIAGCYGIGGLQIDLRAFFKYFDGQNGFLNHLEDCKEDLDWICESPEYASNMKHLISWAQHIIKGGRVRDGIDVFRVMPRNENLPEDDASNK